MRGVLSLAVAVSLAALPALAQQRPQGGFGRGGGMMTGMLLGQESVQNELKLTEAQLKTVKELGEKQREAMKGLQAGGGAEGFKKIMEMMQENEKAYTNLLKPDQAKRLRQISLQVQGPRALSSPDVAKELDVTAEQQEKIREVQAESFKQSAGLFAPGGNPEEMRKKMQEADKKAQEKVLALLTAEQKTKWKEMTGAPFKGDIQMGFPGAFRRPPK